MQTRMYGINANTGVFDSARPVRRSKCSITLKEPLLGFCGMSQFKPSRMIPEVDFLPPMIQDYNLTLGQHTCVKSGCDAFDVVEIKPDREYKVQIRSVQNFDQATKPLQKADISYPVFKRFESSTDTCSFELMDGPPDEVFLYVENDRTAGVAWSEYQPVIETVQLKLLGQDVDSISKLDNTHMYYSTKNNSNARCDTNFNRKFRGAVLLKKYDFENWAQWQDVALHDTFKGSFTVKRSTVEQSFKPDEEVVDALSLAAKTFVVVFVYDSHSFKGEMNRCRFWRTDV